MARGIIDKANPQALSTHVEAFCESMAIACELAQRGSANLAERELDRASDFASRMPLNEWKRAKILFIATCRALYVPHRATIAKGS